MVVEKALERIQTALDKNSDWLNLCYLGLTELPPEIGKLTNLKYLSCSDNKINSLPPEIGNLTNLEKLWCSWNLLTSLPPEIGKLMNLKRLYCYSNPLTTFPSFKKSETHSQLISFLQQRWLSIKCLRTINYGRYDLLENNKSYTSYIHYLPPELIEEIVKWIP